MSDFLLSYDNFYLRPKHSTLKSRSDAITFTDFCGWHFNIPVIPANMKDVISVKNSKWLSENGYFYIYHRFGNSSGETVDENLNTVYFVKLANKENWKLISISTGVSEESKKEILTIKALRQRVDFITIDVAHADHDNVKEMIQFIRNLFPLPKNYDKDELLYIKYPRLIVGNVATAEGYKYLCNLDVDAVKVGIGGGSICSTKFKTGFHLPTAASILECSKLGIDVPIIADGGATHFGDISKALTLGATMLMSGKFFVECSDSPAKIQNGKKIYRGSTSLEFKGHNNHIEGHVLELFSGVTYEERMKEIQQSLQSSISYAGGKDLSAFNSVEWEMILPFH